MMNERKEETRNKRKQVIYKCREKSKNKRGWNEKESNKQKQINNKTNNLQSNNRTNKKIDQ